MIRIRKIQLFIIIILLFSIILFESCKKGKNPTDIAEGNSWQEHSSEISDVLTSVHFVDDNTGWVVGWNGIILQTTDGGNNWRMQNIKSRNLRSVHFIDSSTGWAVGENNRTLGSVVLQTNNGGNSWDKQFGGIPGSLYSVYFVNGSIGWAVGAIRLNDTTFKGIVLKTTKGGN